MHGAITLCAKSMLRSGVGMLTLCIPHDIVPILSLKIEECMILDVPAKDGYFAKEAIGIVKENLDAYDTIVIGNGMGRNDVTHDLVKCVLESDKPCILDGDALFVLGQQLSLLEKRKATTILTPHPKEVSYLTGRSIHELLQDPFAQALHFTSQFDQVVLIWKDQYTMVTDGKGLCINTAGNNALAKGGSGDVLCGIIAGLFAQSKNAYHASIAGVYVHALCADTLIQKEDANSILPSDLIMILSQVYKALRME